MNAVGTDIGYAGVGTYNFGSITTFKHNKLTNLCTTTISTALLQT